MTVKYDTSSGEVSLSPSTIKNFLTSGEGKITDEEAVLYMGWCKANKFNPFNKEAFLIKYGTAPASMVPSKDVFFKRAISNKNYNGFKSGIVVLNKKDEIEKREGSIYIKEREQLIGAWCEVHRKDWEYPTYQDVNFEEFAGRKKGGELNANWSGKPAVMILKVAEATALRKAFTEELGALYIDEEMEQQPQPQQFKTEEITESETVEVVEGIIGDIVDGGI